MVLILFIYLFNFFFQVNTRPFFGQDELTQWRLTIDVLNQ